MAIISQMRREIIEIPDAAERFLTHGLEAAEQGAALAQACAPHFLCSVARGSSDHACAYLGYASALMLGLPMVSMGPSLATIYKAELKLERSLCLAVSQSGASPDLAAMQALAQAGGALCLAIVNDPASQLAQGAAHVIDIQAGPEKSVAATKSFINSLIAGLYLLAKWREDAALIKALRDLPEALARAIALDWPELRKALQDARALYVLGRGPALGIAHEAALKFIEICQINAQAYSSAEVKHGPLALIGPGFPALGFAANDAAQKGTVQTLDALAQKGALAFLAADRAHKARRLGLVRTGHPLTDPLCLIASFYAMIERLAHERGLDPDNPPHLQKVTKTQ